MLGAVKVKELVTKIGSYLLKIEHRKKYNARMYR